jgi:hypothetical protein
MPTQDEWSAARAWLRGLRQLEPGEPYAVIARISLREPRSGRSFSGRGVLGVDPRRAVRLVVLGPAGSTAVDVWVTRDAWRIHVPAAAMSRRGGQDEDPFLPVGFFRWWFLGPVDGRLLTAVAGDGSLRLVLRSEGDTIDLRDRSEGDGHEVIASRRRAGSEDRLEFRGRSLPVSPGDRAVYDQESSGVHVEVAVESWTTQPPPGVFEDPDGPNGERTGS